MGETTYQVVGEMTRWRNDSGETTQGERESGRNDPLPNQTSVPIC